MDEKLDLEWEETQKQMKVDEQKAAEEELKIKKVEDYRQFEELDLS